jgi:hypothetical protein
LNACQSLRAVRLHGVDVVNLNLTSCVRYMLSAQLAVNSDQGPLRLEEVSIESTSLQVLWMLDCPNLRQVQLVTPILQFLSLCGGRGLDLIALIMSLPSLVPIKICVDDTHQLDPKQISEMKRSLHGGTKFLDIQYKTLADEFVAAFY